MSTDPGAPAQAPLLTDLVDLELQVVEVGVAWQRKQEALLKLCWKTNGREVGWAENTGEV